MHETIVRPHLRKGREGKGRGMETLVNQSSYLTTAREDVI